MYTPKKVLKSLSVDTRSKFAEAIEYSACYVKGMKLIPFDKVKPLKLGRFSKRMIHIVSGTKYIHFDYAYLKYLGKNF